MCPLLGVLQGSQLPSAAVQCITSYRGFQLPSTAVQCSTDAMQGGSAGNCSRPRLSSNVCWLQNYKSISISALAVVSVESIPQTIQDIDPLLPNVVNIPVFSPSSRRLSSLAVWCLVTVDIVHIVTAAAAGVMMMLTVVILMLLSEY